MRSTVRQIVEVFPGKYQVALSCGHRVCVDRRANTLAHAEKDSEVLCPLCSRREWDELRPGALYYVAFSIPPYSAGLFVFVSFLPGQQTRGVFAMGAKRCVIWMADVFTLQEIPK